MRIVIDSLIGLMLVGVLAVALFMQHAKHRDEQTAAQVREALSQLREQTDYHAAIESAATGKDTMVVHVDANWFGQVKPVNTLLDDEHPWIDLAPPGDLGVHPPDPVVTREGQAGFWYNPTVGVFRARVIPQASEARTLALYNEVNSTILPAFDELPDLSRKPIAHVPGKTPANVYASMANRTWLKSEVTAQAREGEEKAAQHALEPAVVNASDHSDDWRESTPNEPETIYEVLPEQAEPNQTRASVQGPDDADVSSKPALEADSPRPRLE